MQQTIATRFAIFLAAVVFVLASAHGSQVPAPSGPSANQAPAPESTPQQTPSVTPQPENHDHGCCGPAYRMVERTVFVPTPVRETRTVQCVEYTTEARQQTVTVMRAVPEKQTITRE